MRMFVSGMYLSADKRAIIPSRRRFGLSRNGGVTAGRNQADGGGGGDDRGLGNSAPLRGTILRHRRGCFSADACGEAAGRDRWPRSRLLSGFLRGWRAFSLSWLAGIGGGKPNYAGIRRQLQIQPQLSRPTRQKRGIIYIASQTANGESMLWHKAYKSLKKGGGE